MPLYTYKALSAYICNSISDRVTLLSSFRLFGKSQTKEPISSKYKLLPWSQCYCYDCHYRNNSNNPFCK